MTDFCKQFFGKSLLDMTYEDVEVFFEEEREESNILEFKSGQPNNQEFDGTLNKKIIRAIASFLNSEGGLLIWGSPREYEKEKGDKHVKVAQGALRPNNVFNEKDQLMNKITRAISYMPTGITMNTLQNGSEFIYIFEVQESKSKPHQYAEQYPIRIDGQTVPAPHYLVDSLFKQINDADIEVGIHLNDFIWEPGYLTLFFKMVIFNFNRYIPARNVNVNLHSNAGEFNSTGSRDINIKTIDSVSFGSFPSSNYSLFIKENVLNRFDNTIELSISTSSHNCLSKISTYKINVDRILNEEEGIVTNDLLENIKSNIPLIDLIDSNSSKEDIKRMFLES